MTRDDWRRIKDIAGSALEEPESSRAAYVEERCGRDDDLRREVESLIASATRADALFETPSVLIAGASAALESLRQFEAPRIGERVGSYRIVRELGSGGMGEAFLAVRADAEYEKRVAIKLIRRGMDSTAVLRRFRNERQILADLEHPNIARLLDGGTTADGLPYFVMEYVEGMPIDEHCDTRQLSTREKVALFRRVCDAVQHAHGQYVVHRDLKPSNILVTADGVPKLLDFGISKLLTDSARGSTEPTLLPHAMTPTYASPEQVSGDPITPATDVYSLGVLLYELLTGRRPYQVDGRTLREINDVICHQEPAPPSTVAPAALRAGLAGDLDTIVLMALRKEPQRRYPTVDALSDDLRRHLEGLPVQARADDVAYRVTRLISRHRLRIVEGAVVAALVVLVAVMGPWSGSEVSTPPADISSVAVLPFAIASSDRDVAYLSEGLTEGLIQTLTEFPRLRVLSRNAVFAVNHDGRDPQLVAGELKVGALLLGSVAQSGENVSISLELVDGGSGRRLWEQKHDGQLSSLVSLRDEVTRNVVDRLGLRSEAGIRPPARQTRNSDAYELYLKGRYVWNKRTEDGFRRGLEYFRQAIDKDPQYALAYTGLADCYNLLGIWGALPPHEAMPQVKDAALKAIAIDGTLAEAHTSLAFVYWVYDWDWDAAAAEFQRAVALDPGYATAHDWYAYYLASRGNFDEAIASIARARELEPVSLSIGTDVGEIHYWARRYEKAASELEAVLQVEPDFAMARNILGLTYLAMGRRTEAVAQLEEANRLATGPRMLSTLAYAYGAAGMRPQADGAIDALTRLASERYTSAFALGLAHLGAGDTEQAVRLLEQAFVERSDSMVILRVYPLLDPLRGDRRFRTLLDRVGIPARLP
jgi:TolB-like protein/Flp pilus assembly protein TadD/tRNA A-37 threonylcarbamoyl transferase component Bud32